MSKHFNLAVDADGIALITMDSPGRSMNVFAPDVEREFGEVVERVASDAAIKGAILTSGKSSFLAGYDLTELVQKFDRNETAVQAYDGGRGLTVLFRRMETSGKPWVAAINGLALGGGFEVCLACHYRVMTDDPKAFVGLPEVKVGLLPGAGGTQRMPRLAGIANSLPFLLEGTQHFRSGGQEARPRARSRAGGRTDRRGEALAAGEPKRGAAVGPEGLQDARRGGLRQRGRGRDVPGCDGARRQENAAQLPGAGRDPVVCFRRHDPADRQGARNRVEVFRNAGHGARRPQPDPDDVREQGQRGQAFGASRGRAPVTSQEAGRAWRRHDGCGRCLCVGHGWHGRRVDRCHARGRGERQGLFGEVAGQGSRKGPAQAGAGRCDPRPHQADGRLRAARRRRPRDRGGVRKPRHQGGRHRESRGGHSRAPRCSPATRRRCRSRASPRRRSGRRISSASTSFRRSRRCRSWKSSSASRPATRRLRARSTMSASCARRRSSSTTAAVFTRAVFSAPIRPKARPCWPRASMPH